MCCMQYRVPNALPGRGSVNVEIFGMAGVPEGAAPGVTVPTGVADELLARMLCIHLHLLSSVHTIPAEQD